MLSRAYAVADYLIKCANDAYEEAHSTAKLLQSEKGWEIMEALEWHLVEMTKAAHRLRIYERFLAELNRILEGGFNNNNNDANPSKENSIRHWHSSVVARLHRNHYESAARCMGWSTSPGERFTARCMAEVNAGFIDSQFGLLKHINHHMGDNGDYA